MCTTPTPDFGTPLYLANSLTLTLFVVRSVSISSTSHDDYDTANNTNIRINTVDSTVWGLKNTIKIIHTVGHNTNVFL